ncbi:conserved hypothetical protein [delta proteobacterium NaphS2]|nr:conserved hypothetical protein [delta proteobacterium NaphS2]
MEIDLHVFSSFLDVIPGLTRNPEFPIYAQKLDSGFRRNDVG